VPNFFQSLGEYTYSLQPALKSNAPDLYARKCKLEHEFNLNLINKHVR